MRCSFVGSTFAHISPPPQRGHMVNVHPHSLLLESSQNTLPLPFHPNSVDVYTQKTSILYLLSMYALRAKQRTLCVKHGMIVCVPHSYLFHKHLINISGMNYCANLENYNFWIALCYTTGFCQNLLHYSLTGGVWGHPQPL